MTVSTDFWTWSSTASSNSPQGTDTIGTSADDVIRNIQAAIRNAFAPLSSVAGTNTITATQANLTAYATGMEVRFTPANSNTGATTINVSSLGAKSIYLNGAALVGYELRKNMPVTLRYNGTQFDIVAGAHGDGIPIGKVYYISGTTVPSGHLAADGTAVSRTTYADYFAYAGTTFGTGDGSTTFNVPDATGRALFGLEGTATRLTSGVSGVDGGTLGASGGDQNAHHATISITDPGHTHTLPNSLTNITATATTHVMSDAGSGNTSGSSTTGITAADDNTGASQNIPPALVLKAVVRV